MKTNNTRLMETGKTDINGDIICLHDKIKVSGTYFNDGIYKVRYGVGTYDSGVYEYLGWYLEDENGETDSYGHLLSSETPVIEIMKSWKE